MRQPQVSPDTLIHRGVVAGRKQIGPAVVVVVEEPRGEAPSDSRHAGPFGDVRERSVMVVVVQKVVAVQVRDVEIHIPVAVIVRRGHAFGESRPVDARRVGDILKGPVSFIQEKLGRAAFVGHEQVQQAVVVNVRPDRGLGIGGRHRQAALFGHIRKGPIAIVAQQRFALPKALPGSAQHQHIQTSVVVVVRLYEAVRSEKVPSPLLWK